MPKHRKTRYQKMESQHRIQARSASQSTETSLAVHHREILIVPSYYINADLRKTLLLSTIFIAIIFGIHLYLKNQAIDFSFLRF